MVRYSTRTRESSSAAHQQTYQDMQPRTDHKRQTTNKRTHGEKFVKSGERTDKADGHVQDRPRFLTGSKASPPTHPKTNKFCDSLAGGWLGLGGSTQRPSPRASDLSWAWPLCCGPPVGGSGTQQRLLYLYKQTRVLLHEYKSSCDRTVDVLPDYGLPVV